MVDVQIMAPSSVGGARTSRTSASIESLKPRVTKRPNTDVFAVEYTARDEGLHLIHVLFAGQPVPRSPFQVFVEARMLELFGCLPTCSLACLRLL